MNEKKSKSSGTSGITVKKSYSNGVKVLPVKTTERPDPRPNNPNTGKDKK